MVRRLLVIEYVLHTSSSPDDTIGIKTRYSSEVILHFFSYQLHNRIFTILDSCISTVRIVD